MFHHITQNLFWNAQNCGPVSEFFLALVWKLVIVHEDNIIVLSNDTEISGLLKISGVCMEISSMCPEIWILHKDCAIFNPMTQNIPDCSKSPVVSKNLQRVFENSQIGSNFWSVSRNF